tara:strand:+ start:298 stop:588 length:291 start_codon:yes stop_codon:yes gene_type:complete
MMEYDRQNVASILKGHGDWFGAALLRTIAQGDNYQRALLFMSFPHEVQAVYNLDLPPGPGGEAFDQLLERLWVKADSPNRQRLAYSFVRFEMRFDH